MAMYTTVAPAASSVADPAFADFTVDPSGLHLAGTVSIPVAFDVR
jgi:hypothetical protein